MGQFARFEAAIWRFLREIGRDCCREAGSAEFSFVFCSFGCTFCLDEVIRGTGRYVPRTLPVVVWVWRSGAGYDAACA